MKPLITLLGIFLTTVTFAQQTTNQFLPSAPLIGYSTEANVEYQKWTNNDNNYASSSAASAADVVLWSEDFANGLSGNNPSIIQTWTVGGTDANVWEHDFNGSDGPNINNSYTLNSETKTNGWMIFDADKSNANAIKPSDKQGELVSPDIDLSQDTNVTLQFTHRYVYCCKNAHKLNVKIFDGTEWQTIQVNEGGNVNIIEKEITRKINISQYAGLKSNVKIKFVWEGEGAAHYFWMIDDVKILKSEQYAVDLLGAFYSFPTSLGGVDYTIIPKKQINATNVYFIGAIENFGYDNVDSARVQAKLTSDNGTFSAVSNGIVSLPTKLDTIITNTGFSTNSVGAYLFDVFATNDFNQFSSDTFKFRVEVNEYLYGIDGANQTDATFQSRLVNQNNGAFEVGNRFRMYESETLEYVSVRLSSETDPLAKGKVVVNVINNSGEIEFLSESAEIELGKQAKNKWINLKTKSTTLEKGKEYIVTLRANAPTGNDSLYLSYSGASTSLASFYHDIDNVNNEHPTIRWFVSSVAPCLRLNFDPNATSIEEKQSNPVKFDVYPNPNNGIFKLSFDEGLSENSYIEIHNILGQLVHEEFLSSHILTKEVNLKHLKKGIYTISLNMGAETAQTQKIIIK